MAVRMPADLSGFAEDEYLAFFQFIYAVHKKAERGSGGYRDLFFSIGDRPVLLRFVGDTVADVLSPALAHLRISPTNSPELTVLIWDSASSGTEMPSILLALL